MKTQSYQIQFSPEEQELYDAIEQARITHGLTRKGMILYALANQYPELTETIVRSMLQKGKRRGDQETLAKEGE